jgi:hypothetical protein
MTSITTERIRAEIDELFASERELASILEDVACLSVRLVFQAGLEAQVDQFPGRTRYQRRDDDRLGSRNGFQPPTAVKATIGPVELQCPKLRPGERQCRWSPMAAVRGLKERSPAGSGYRALASRSDGGRALVDVCTGSMGGLVGWPYAGWPWKRTPPVNQGSALLPLGPVSPPTPVHQWEALFYKSPAQSRYGGRDRV